MNNRQTAADFDRRARQLQGSIRRVITEFTEILGLTQESS